MTEHEFIEYVAGEAGKFASIRQAARALGMTPTYLGYVLQGKRTPGPKVLKALGWEVVKEYRQKQKSGADEI